MADLGLLGICKARRKWRLRFDYSYNLVVAEELGTCSMWWCASSDWCKTDMATPALARFGSKELREEFLNPAIRGEYVASIAVSEVHAGSDVAAVKTTAKKDGDDYVINGSKMWITNSLQSDFFCLLANTSDDKPHVNKSMIIVPAKLQALVSQNH